MTKLLKSLWCRVVGHNFTRTFNFMPKSVQVIEVYDYDLGPLVIYVKCYRCGEAWKKI